jgi:integrase
MAFITKTPTGWRARWRTPDGQSRSQTFKRQADAQRHLTSVEHSRLTGAYVDPTAEKITFPYAEKWRAIQVHRHNTVCSIKSNLTNHVYPRIGDRPIGAIRPSEIQTLVKGLEGVLAPSTIEVVYTWTTAVFNAAVNDQVIAKTPCREIKRPELPAEKVEPLPVETVEVLIGTVPDRFRAVMVLGAGAGVRAGEALGVTSDRVDWARRFVTIDRQLLAVKAGVPMFGPPKNNKERTIPLPTSVLAALVEHVRRFGLGPDGLLFTNSEGRPVKRAGFGEMWRKAADPLGIPVGDGYHQLRHFYASLLIRHGENVKVVAERLGDSTQVVLDTYAHLWPGDDDRTRDAVDEVLGAAASQPRHSAVGEA